MAERIQEPIQKVKRHATICESLNRIYEKKNHDYGDSFGKSIRELGIVAAITRIYDKMQRLISLTKVVAKVTDESTIDTLMDLANYCIMTIIELEGIENGRSDTRVSSEFPPLPGEYTECGQAKSN